MDLRRTVAVLFLSSGIVPLAAEQPWRTLLAAADRLKSEGRLAESERTYWSAVDETSRLAPDFAPAAAAYHELAGFYQDIGRCDSATQAYERSLTLWEKAGAGAEAYLFRTANHLVGLDLECGAVAAAERHYRALVAPRLAARVDRGPHSDVAQALTNLGSIDYHRRRYSAARSHFEAALAMRAQLPAAPPVEIAILLSNLAHALLHTRETDRAVAMSRRAVEEAELDAAAPRAFVAATLVNAAEVHAAAQCWPEAEAWIARALTLSRGSDGHDQPLTAVVLSRYAVLLKAQRRKREAAALESRARAIQLEFSGGVTQQTVHVRELSILK